MSSVLSHFIIPLDSCGNVKASYKHCTALISGSVKTTSNFVTHMKVPVLAVDDHHVAFCEYNGSVARIICVAVATLANEKILKCASDHGLLLNIETLKKLKLRYYLF
jgi:hypothetical protein